MLHRVDPPGTDQACDLCLNAFQLHAEGVQLLALFSSVTSPSMELSDRSRSYSDVRRSARACAVSRSVAVCSRRRESVVVRFSILVSCPRKESRSRTTSETC